MAPHWLSTIYSVTPTAKCVPSTVSFHPAASTRNSVQCMQGMMKPEGRALITSLTYFVFFPALVITSLGTSVTLDTLQSWWPVPVSTFLNVVLGMALGAIVFPFVGMERHLWPHFVSCAGVGNLGNLLIVLVPSIASKATDVFTEQDGEDGLAYVFTGLFAMCALLYPCGPCYSIRANSIEQRA
jgi:predicted permease